MVIFGGIPRTLFASVFEPESLVESKRTLNRGSTIAAFQELKELGAIYLINLALYAGPLTIAGVGRQGVPSQPEWFPSLLGPSLQPVAWEFAYAFVENSLYLLAATMLTLVTFHFVLVGFRQSKGFLRTARGVVYSTSIYLAGIFTIVWYITFNPGIGPTRRVVVNVQKSVVYAVIDFMGAGVGLPGGRPQGIPLGELTGHGQLVLALLALLGLYYFYSMYLAARVNHDAARVNSLFAVTAVALSPIAYVVLSVIAFLGQGVPSA